jgi:hypothetical protein
LYQLAVEVVVKRFGLFDFIGWVEYGAGADASHGVKRNACEAVNYSV